MQRLGRYEVMRRIASGGMATVYLGRALGEGGFQRLVAVKMMHGHLAEDPDFVAMFLDEARLAASIRHPNVVATLDVQRVPEGLFLVMDYIDGPTLARMLKLLERTGRQMDLAIALRIFLDVLAGLDAAHELIGPNGEPLHLIHRDVSPSNVLVGSDGVSRITDFGIARAEARITSTRGRQLKGKLPYMAPEQLASKPIDRRVDVYAAGCMLWEILTLQRLFQGDDEAQLLAAVLVGAKEPPSALRPEIPAGIDLVCMQALGTTETRFPTAAAFAEALEDAARREGIRLASLRDVGRFVRELAPTPTEPASAAEPAGGGLPGGMVTPQRWQATPPAFGAGSQPPVLVGQRTPISAVPALGAASADRLGGSPQGQGATGAVAGSGLIPGTKTPMSPALVFDTNPNTNASMVATPAPSPMARQRALITIVAALGVATLGGIVAYIVTGPPAPPAGVSSAPTSTDTTSTTTTDTEAAATTTTTTSETAGKTATTPTGRVLPKPRPKQTSEPKTQPPPTATNTEWRPVKP